MRHQLDFARLQTPREHGETLIEPAAVALPAIVEENRAALARSAPRVLDLTFDEVRGLARRLAGRTVGEPLVVTGHQPDWIHAGVWAKHVVAMELARRIGGVALNLVVDHDAPKSTALEVPFITEGRVRARGIHYTECRRGAAFEFLPASDAGRSARLRDEIRAAMGEYYAPSMLDVYFDAYLRGAGSHDWVDQAVSARRKVESEFGVEVHDEKVSRLWCGPLCGELFLNADRFATIYNRALGAYRRRHRVRGDRPVPDLVRDGDRCEVAVWVYRPGEPRRRAFVSRRGDRLELWAGQEKAAELDAVAAMKWHTLQPQLRALSPWVVRPRALTLTLWARVVLGDIFIHGIGGAKYDRVTDELIEGYFGAAPPGMACVSATLRLNLPQHDVDEARVHTARHRARDVLYNPERYIRDGRIAELIDAKKRAIGESSELRRNRPGDAEARRSVFDEIRSINGQMLGIRPELHSALLSELDAKERQMLENRDARKRDYFFAMHPRGELEMLAERLAGVRERDRSVIV